MTGFFSVCNRHQLPGALALGESILLLHPGARFVIGFADEAPVPQLPDGIELISVAQLGIPMLEEISTRYLDFEFVHAARPWFARYLFSEECSRWVFMAPTTVVYSPIDRLLARSESLLLTPNISKPLPASVHLDDKRILNIGMFHSNAWIARPTAAVTAFLDWWSLRTTDRAFFDLCQGMCLDQLWLNYAPVHVPDHSLIRDPLWHFGLHSALHYQFDPVNGTPFIGGERILSIDFAGLAGFHPVWSDHTSLANQDSDWTALLSLYKKQTDKYAAFNIAGTPRYGRYSPVSPMRNFRKSVKSELDQIIELIDKIEI